ncbi:MAG: hypothetical protein ACSHXK_15375 [Oceanococcus sp.]
MAENHSQNVDRAIARALRDRIKLQTDRAAIELDLERLRTITSRTQDSSLSEALKFLIELRNEEDPDHAKLNAELASLDAALIQQDTAPKQVSAPTNQWASGETLDVVSLPKKLPALSQELVPFDSEIGWPVPPLFGADWVALGFDDMTSAARLAHATFPTVLSASQAASVVAARRAELSFYPGFHIIELLVQETDGTQYTQIALYGSNRALHITGKSPGIHNLNAGGFKSAGKKSGAASPLDISTVQKATDYLKFFCGCVHGEEGGFNLIESYEQLNDRWAGIAAPQHLEEKISAIKVIPDENPDPGADESETVQIDGEPHAGLNGKANGSEEQTSVSVPMPNWRLEAIVLYSNALFFSTFEVQPSGMVEMLNDDPISADLPIRRDGFINGLRSFDATSSDAD